MPSAILDAAQDSRTVERRRGGRMSHQALQVPGSAVMIVPKSVRTEPRRQRWD